MLLIRPGCMATAFLYVIGLAAWFANAVQPAILVDPLWADDDGSALLFPAPAAPSVPVRALRAVAKSRTATPVLALHASTGGVAQKQKPKDTISSNETSKKQDTTSSNETSSPSNQERMNRLIDSLVGEKTHYHRSLRPLPDCSAHDCSHKIGVTMSLEFQKLLGVDEKANQLEMLAVMTLNWADHRLSYNSSDWFPHLFDWRSQHDFIAMDPAMIWKPDIQLVNAAEPMKQIFQPRAFLYDDQNRIEKGFNVRLKVPNIIKVKCDLLMDDFPFDNQTCKFVYQAWSATTEWISFTATKSSAKNATTAGLTSKNEEFQVTSVDQNDSMIEYGEQVFPQIIYTLKMRRYSHYYVSSIILPMLMMVLLSVGVFYIDPPGGERLGYNITLILTVMATSFFAAERLPKSGGGDTWLERFQAGCYILTMLPLFVSLFCELGRRIAKNFDMAGDDDAGWVTQIVDLIFRVPYALVTAVFIFVVAGKFHSDSGHSNEESVLAILIFLCVILIVMCIVATTSQ